MSKKTTQTSEQKKLMRRYLLWCYKTTKESLDRIDRYFTQLVIDEHVIHLLFKNKDVKDKNKDREYLKKIDEFAVYIEKKEARAISQKYIDFNKKILHPDYWYLQNRLAALEKAIIHFFGTRELKKIKELYEDEMLRRIIEAREHT